MKKATAILLLLVLAMPVYALEKSKEAQSMDRDGITEMSRSVINEVEPNNTFDVGSGPLAGGDQGTGIILDSTDVDFWVINVNVLGMWSISTDAGPAPALGDSYIHLYGPDGTTQLTTDDDSGPGAYSLINYTFTATGTYFVKVRGYSASYTGSYVINVGSPVPPPANDTCATAIAIPFTEGFSVASTTVGAANDYNPLATGCTGYAATGSDIVYTVAMENEQEITLSWTSAADGSLYVVTDCGDMLTCVAGADETLSGQPEVVSFQNLTGAPMTYFIICDSYSGNGAGTLAILAAVPTESSTWGTLKALYN
jgi:hypothetical protein